MNKFEIGKILKEIREELGWTQKEIANLLSVEHEHINNVECGIADFAEKQELFFEDIFGINIYVYAWLRKDQTYSSSELPEIPVKNLAISVLGNELQTELAKSIEKLKGKKVNMNDSHGSDKDKLVLSIDAADRPRRSLIKACEAALDYLNKIQPITDEGLWGCLHVKDILRDALQSYNQESVGQ